MTKCKCGNISQHSKDNAGGICDACYVKENTKAPLGDPDHDYPNCFKNNPDLPL